MNKKEAVAYAQITLDFMQSSKFKGEINLETFCVEMRQSFKLYPKDVALMLANNMVKTEKEILSSKKFNHNFFYNPI